ncbi:MAG: alpha-glucosidase C-terminal domain-containing protein, partial [Bacteroidales bacterium]|nr:alpha-glucosidase C-terminal domain-containing protein [Bacteroidales bacterium]
EFFEKDVIDFSQLPLKDFYAELNNIKHSHSALWNNNVKFLSSDDNVLVFERQSKNEKIICVFNFNADQKEVSLENGKTVIVAAKDYKTIFE